MDTNLNTPTSGNNEDELVPLCSIPSDGSLRQQRVLGRLTSRADETFQEVEVGVDHSVETTLSEYCRQIFEAVTLGDFQTLSILLTNYPTQFNAIDREGNTALHCAVMSACHKRHTHDNYYRCIDMLMNCQEMKINLPNKHGYTALGYALNDLHVTCVEHMLKHPSSNRLYLDYYPGDRESTLSEIIMQTYPDLKPLLPAPIMESLGSSERDIKLLTALRRGDYETFRQNLDSNNSNTWYDEPYLSCLLEIACQMKNRKQFVELLLENSADPKIKNRVTGIPVLHATARSGNFEVLEILLKKDETDASVKDRENRTLLHWWARVSERKPGDKQMLENCFKLLMEIYSVRKMSIDLRDCTDNTALYMAVESGFRDRAKLLLSEGANFMVFEHGNKMLLSASLSIVEEFVDNCLESNDKPATSKDLELRLDCRPLMKIITHMAESHHHRDLLRHPVMSTFLILKWQKVKFVFFIDMFFYVMFVLILTVYILCSDSYNTLNDGGVANNTTGPFSFNDSYITSDINDTNFTSQPNASILHFLWLCLIALLSLLTLREMHQLIIHQQAYIVSLETWLEILLIIATFISCSGVVSFVVLEAIILLNLLNGLAVGDTGQIREKSEVLSLVARAKLISRIEGLLSALPKIIKCSVQMTISVIYQNKPKKISYTAARSLLSIISKEAELNKERESSGNQEKWDMFTEKLSALELRQEKLEKILYSKSDETQQILMQILTRLDNRECETTPL